MRKVSIGDLQVHASELVREAEEGEVVVIERRGEPVAELRAFKKPVVISPEARERIFAEMKELWSKLPPSTSDSTAIVEEDRNR